MTPSQAIRCAGAPTAAAPGTRTGRQLRAAAPPPSHVVTGLVAAEYIFQVRAMAGGLASDRSRSVRVTVPVPAKPVVTAEAGDGQVTLRWTNPYDVSITGYQVKQDTVAWTAIESTAIETDANTLSHTVTGLTNGTAYTFQIRVMQGAVAGDASDAMTATPLANPAPAFATETATLEVAENIASGGNVGAPVTATDADNDTLTYSLSGTDAASFAISSATGQITVATGTSLDYEFSTKSYKVTVSVHDGQDDVGKTDATVDDTIAVTISVTNVDEKPALSGSSAESYAENGAADVASYTAADPERATVTWTVSGDDSDDFSISAAGALSFKSPPNYEEPADADTNNTYLVTVEASDGTSDKVTLAVTVTVTDVDEAGAVALSSTQPVVGTALTATLTDPDERITAATWVWANSTTETGTWTDINGTTAASDTPVDGDLNKYLRATASYTDGLGAGESAQAVSVNQVQAVPVVNLHPIFSDGTATTRSVAENSPQGTNVGTAVSATDAESLTYSLSGTDAGSFDIGTGQITVGSGTTLDYESRNSYAVVVTAADPSGATDTIAVTINVADVNESPTATDDTSTTEENTAVDINVVANDTDPDSGTTLAVTVVSTAPGNGTAVIKSGSTTTVTYTPNTDFNGQDSFTYTLSDGSATATGTVNVVVYTPAPTPSGTQSTQGVPVGAETKAEAPGGDVTVAFPQGASTGTPFQVRVDDAPNQDCGNLPSGQIVVGCSQVDLFKLDGEDWDTVDGTPFDSANLIISVSNTQDISVYRREDPSDSWTSIPPCEVGSTDEVECFTVSGGLVIIQNIPDFSQFAVVRPRPSSQVVTPTETATPPPTVIPPPTPGGGGAATITRRRRGGSIVRATATPAPMVVATPAPTKMAVPATVASTAVPPTPELRAVVQPTAAPPTPAPTPMAAIVTPTVAPAPTDTPAAVAAIPNTPVPAATTAVPPAVETGGGFPLWLIAAIFVAVLVAGGLGFCAWRMLRPT